MIITNTGATWHSSTCSWSPPACCRFVLFGADAAKSDAGQKRARVPRDLLEQVLEEPTRYLIAALFKHSSQLPPLHPCSNITQSHTSTAAAWTSPGFRWLRQVFGPCGVWCLFMQTLTLSELALLTEGGGADFLGSFQGHGWELVSWKS